MIYQMEIFYGALLNGQAIYSMSTKLDNCTVFPKKEFNEDYFKEPLVKLIKSKDDDPDNYEFCYLTKEQYEKRFDIENEDVKEIEIKR